MNSLLVLFLAGGKSLRLWPLKEKHFLKFLGKPLIYYPLLQCQKFGLQDIVIIVNKENIGLFENIKKEFTKLKITLVLQKDGDGMAGAILSASDYIKGREILIIGPTDICEDLLFFDFLKVKKTNPQAIIPGINFPAFYPGAYLRIENSKITEVVEKPSLTDLPSHTVKFVFDYFQKGEWLTSAIKKVNSQKDDVYEQSLNLLINQGILFKLLSYSGFWGHLKYPWHVLNLNNYFLERQKSQKFNNVFIDKTAKISGNVVLEEGVKVLENVKIIGPTYIGRGTLVGQNCLVRESMVGANCVLGYSTEIARSFIGDNCWFHTNFVGDSVFGKNISLGSGAVMANFRLDEETIKSQIKGKMLDTGKNKLGVIVGDNTRIGVNVSVMPGIKIGRNSFLGSGVVLDKDLLDNKYCTLEHKKYLVKDNLVNISNKTRDLQMKNLKI